MYWLHLRDKEKSVVLASDKTAMPLMEYDLEKIVRINLIAGVVNHAVDTRLCAFRNKGK